MFLLCFSLLFLTSAILFCILKVAVIASRISVFSSFQFIRVIWFSLRMVYINFSFIDSIDGTLVKSLLDSCEVTSVVEGALTSPLPPFALGILTIYRKYMNINESVLKVRVKCLFAYARI